MCASQGKVQDSPRIGARVSEVKSHYWHCALFSGFAIINLYLLNSLQFDLVGYLSRVFLLSAALYFLVFENQEI
jgi:hypothetical protein